MPKIKFYDVKKKKAFMSDKFVFKKKQTKSGMRYFAVSNAPSGIKAWRLVSKKFYMKNK